MMTNHETAAHEEWLPARLELLQAKKELTRRSENCIALSKSARAVRLTGEGARRVLRQHGRGRSEC
jgi:predicted dithiol-disulfide oxidoreductase (DUF899 family)